MSDISSHASSWSGSHFANGAWGEKGTVMRRDGGLLVGGLLVDWLLVACCIDE